MKTLSLIILTIFGVFGLWKIVLAFRPVSVNHTPISDQPSAILKHCIAKLNSSDSLCLSDFKGKKILLVNVASECGFTKQYAELEKLHTTYSDKLVVLGFPCNQFGGQESGSEQEIAKFCSSKFGVSFPLTTKIDVKGQNQHAIYAWLTNKAINGVDDYKVSWNFNKFLLDENGQLIGYFSSKVNPLDDEITKLLK